MKLPEHEAAVGGRALCGGVEGRRPPQERGGGVRRRVEAVVDASFTTTRTV